MTDRRDELLHLMKYPTKGGEPRRLFRTQKALSEWRLTYWQDLPKYTPFDDATVLSLVHSGHLEPIKEGLEYYQLAQKGRSHDTRTR